MQRCNLNKNFLTWPFVFASVFPAISVACESDTMVMTESGFITKVVAGSDKIVSYKDASATEEAFPLELLQPYFVICEEGDYYKITDQPADTVEEAMAGQVGFVLREQTHEWTTREALSFSEIAFLEDRPEIVAWDQEDILEKFMESGNNGLYPPAFKEDLEATRMRERATRPYPVLGSKIRQLRKTADKRVYNVLLPAAITPASAAVINPEDFDKAQAALTTATILVVFDATGSMEAFALETANAISAGLTSLPKEVVDGSSMGFLFYRDAGDTEPLLEIPPLPLGEAADALRKTAAYMDGGGDAAEPILDAVYYGANIYNWGQSGRKIMIGVLNDDAKPATTGTLDVEGRVPSGLDAFAIAKDLYDKNIPLITVQAGPNTGENLTAVLQTLGDESTGSFIAWGAGLDEKSIAEAMTIQLGKTAEMAIDAGKEGLAKVKYDLNGFASIPLEVLDGEMLERLRTAGVDFNIDSGEGGVLVRPGFILENNDLLSPEIQIDKETLLNLINLYSVLATTGVDTEAMIQAISEAIAAIAGEGYDPTEPIETIIEKKLGIEFRSDLLNFDLAYITALTPNERLAMTKRIQDAATTLSQYLEANQAEFDEQVAVWMPIAALP